MTQGKKFKKRARALAKEKGITYTAALEILLHEGWGHSDDNEWFESDEEAPGSGEELDWWLRIDDEVLEGVKKAYKHKWPEGDYTGDKELHKWRQPTHADREYLYARSVWKPGKSPRKEFPVVEWKPKKKRES